MLRARGVEFDIVEYLKTPLHRTALERIVAMLDTPPAELVRKDRRFEGLQLKPADYVSAANQMNCTNAAASDLLELPTGLRTHGGMMLFPPGSPEALIIQMWPSVKTP